MKDAIAVQRENGKLTAGERLELLLDPASFQAFEGIESSGGGDTGLGRGDGVITGGGTVNGRAVFVYAKDIAVAGGALSEAQARKILQLQERALRARAALIGLFDSPGVGIDAGLGALAAYGEIYRRSVCAFGVIPQISVIMGPCIGADAFVAASSDFLFMVRDRSALFVTGPEVVRAASYESVGAEDLGGASMHAAESGIADGAYDNDVEALLQIRRLLDFLPASHDLEPPQWPSFDDPERIDPSLDSLVPDDPTCAYDIEELIVKIADEGDFFEIQAMHAPNIVTGFARIEGRPIALVANRPLALAGVLDADAARKATRFIRFCNGFKIPIVTFVDVPGFLPGAAQERGRIVKHGAELLFAYAQSRVPKLTIVIRNAFGAAYAMMGSKALGADVVYAWPSAQIGLVGMQGAAQILPSGERADYARALSPVAAAASGLIDAIIAPHETRPRVARALALLRNKNTATPSQA